MWYPAFPPSSRMRLMPPQSWLCTRRALKATNACSGLEGGAAAGVALVDGQGINESWEIFDTILVLTRASNGGRGVVVIDAALRVLCMMFWLSLMV